MLRDLVKNARKVTHNFFVLSFVLFVTVLCIIEISKFYLYVRIPDILTILKLKKKGFESSLLTFKYYGFNFKVFDVKISLG